jgi:ketosteroid isomerase-like protein
MDTTTNRTTGDSHITADDLADLVRRMDQAAQAYIRGDLRGYVACFGHADDYTLMPPYGGPTHRGFELTEENVEETRRFFASGESAFDVQESYASGDLAVLVGVERQHGVVGGFPDQDWSLRVTLVFRRGGDGWELAHRHADPIVERIPFDRFAELARDA